MRNALSFVFVVLVAACGATEAQRTLPAKPARPPVVSNSSMTVTTLDGPEVGSTQTIALPFMNNFENKGDWYVTPTDAHAAFFVADALATKLGRIDLTMNGQQTTLVINFDNNKNTGHKTDQGFQLMLGSAQKPADYGIGKNDAVTVTVTKMDSLTFEATVSGMVSQLAAGRPNTNIPLRMKVSGVISLHRASAPPEISAGNYIDCDPIIHDWLNDALNRASSDCEVKFDDHLQTALNAAFSPMESAFTASQWQIINKPDPSVLFLSAPRGSEKEPFHGQGFKLTMAVNPNSAQGQQAMAAANTPDPLMVKMMELLKAGKYAEAQELQKQLDAKLKSASPPPSTRFTVQVSFNFSARELINFHGTFSTSALPGGGTVLYLPVMQPLSGGSSGEPGTWVLLGPWSQPTSTHLDGETTKVITKAQMNPSAPRLSVQNIAVYLNCDHDLATNVIQAINWSQLRALLAQ